MLFGGAFRNTGGDSANATVAWRWGLAISLSGLMAMAVCMAKLGAMATPRLLAPYYPLLIGSVLFVPGATRLIRQLWWRRLALCVALSSLFVVVLTPARPLWPALAILRKIDSMAPGNPLAKRALNVYTIYQGRSDALAPLRQFVVSGESQVGFVGLNDPETALWRPFGTRVVKEVTVSNQWDIARKPITVMASNAAVEEIFGQTVDGWVTSLHGRVIGQTKILKLAAVGPEDWFAIRLGETSGPFNTGNTGERKTRDEQR